MQLKRKVWFIKGMLLYGIKDLGRLEKVVQNFERIGAIPVGYNYPELLLADDVPKYLREAFDRKHEHKGRAAMDNFRHI